MEGLNPIERALYADYEAHMDKVMPQVIEGVWREIDAIPEEKRVYAPPDLYNLEEDWRLNDA